jgi:hypothetical protein
MIVGERRCGYLPYRLGERRLLRRPLPLVLGAETVPSAARPDRAVRVGASPARAGHGSVRLAQPLQQRRNWTSSDRLRPLNREESLI